MNVRVRIADAAAGALAVLLVALPAAAEMDAAAAEVSALASPSGVDAEPLRAALIIGNNQAPSGDTATLRYADDDALATAELLGEAGLFTVVLTRLDDQTRQLHPQAAPFDVPTRPALARAVAELTRFFREARAAGRRGELLLFYSGHGDVERGEGWLALEGGRLTRRELHAHVLAPIAPAASHVVIDACRSSFMAFARGPGGARSKATAGFSRPALESRVGFALSTSSDRDSHEWERFQAGVFSHEVRSALRGAADANGDALLVDEGRSHVEDALGQRLIDVPPATSSLAIRLPRARQLFVTSGPNERVLEPGVNETRASALPAARSGLAARGGVHDAAFRALFATPFGADAVAQYRTRPPAGIALAAPAMAPLAVAGWATLGVSAVAAAAAITAAGAGWGVYSSSANAAQPARVAANEAIATLNLAAAVGAGVAAAGATAALTLFAVEVYLDDGTGDPP